MISDVLSSVISYLKEKLRKRAASKRQQADTQRGENNNYDLDVVNMNSKEESQQEISSSDMSEDSNR